MQINCCLGRKLRSIAVQLPEMLNVENSTQKAAADCCDLIGIPRNISSLSKERIRRAGKKIKEENAEKEGVENLDTGFRVFKLDSSNIQEWRPKREDIAETLEEHAEHVKEDRSEQDILFELLLKLGLDLCIPIEEREVAGKTVYNIGAGTLLVCLAKEVKASEVEELALGLVAWCKELDAGETQCVFRDSAYADNNAKSNLTAILNQNGLQNVRSL